MSEIIKFKRVQTRDHRGELKYFETVSEALLFAKLNSEVWKISFNTSSEERIRLVKDEKTGNFFYEPILEL